MRKTYHFYLTRQQIRDFVIVQLIAFALAVLFIVIFLEVFIPDPVEKYNRTHKTQIK